MKIDEMVKNYQILKEKIETENYNPSHPCTLIAVSKKTPFSHIEALYQRQAVVHFGENRLSELEDKANLALEKEMLIDWHYIGHLQSNKIRKLLSIPSLRYIHSVENKKQIDLLFHHKDEMARNHHLSYFLQVNTSFETEKGGIPIDDEVLELWKYGKDLETSQGGEKITLIGIMTIGKIRTADFLGDAKKSFDRMAQLQSRIKAELNHEAKLSMGMSQDYQLALELKSDFIRIGSLIFGER